MVAGDGGGVSEHGTLGKGSIEEPEKIHCGLRAERTWAEYAGRYGTFLRKRQTLQCEVGFADSTPSAGKPCTWGSGEADEDWL